MVENGLEWSRMAVQPRVDLAAANSVHLCDRFSTQLPPGSRVLGARSRREEESLSFWWKKFVEGCTGGYSKESRSTRSKIPHETRGSPRNFIASAGSRDCKRKLGYRGANLGVFRRVPRQVGPGTRETRRGEGSWTEEEKRREERGRNIPFEKRCSVAEPITITWRRLSES